MGKKSRSKAKKQETTEKPAHAEKGKTSDSVSGIPVSGISASGIHKPVTNPKQGSLLQGKDSFNLGVFIFAVLSIFSFYLLSMWPSISGGDSGELALVAQTLGIAHPPGYPLFTLFGHLFSFLPLGTIAFRIALLSVAASTAAAALLYLSVHRLTKNPAAALFTAYLFAFTPLIWRYAIQVEVFALNNFFAALLLFLALKQETMRDICLFAFCLGLGLSNHQTLLFLGVPLLLGLCWTERILLLRPENFGRMILSGAVGLLPYAYLPLRSLSSPAFAWGEQSSISGFLDHILRREYGTFQLGGTSGMRSSLFLGLIHFADEFTKSLLFVGWIPLILGIFVVLKKLRRPIGVCLVVAPIFYLVFFHQLANFSYEAIYTDVISRFWQMPMVFFFFFAGLGVDALSHGKKLPANIALLIFCGLRLFLGYQEENRHGNFTFANYARYLASPLPERSVYLSQGDLAFLTVRYMQQAESLAHGVCILNRRIMSYPWLKRNVSQICPELIVPKQRYLPGRENSYDLKDFFDANYGKTSIFLTNLMQHDPIEGRDKRWQEEYTLVPYGALFRVFRKGEAPQLADYIAESKKFLLPPEGLKKPTLKPESWQEVAALDYWNAYLFRGVYVLNEATKQTNNKEFLLESFRIFTLLTENYPTPQPDQYRSLGIAAYALMEQTKGEEKVVFKNDMLRAWEKYLPLSDRSDPLVPQIKKVLEYYGKSSRKVEREF